MLPRIAVIAGAVALLPAAASAEFASKAYRSAGGADSSPLSVRLVLSQNNSSASVGEEKLCGTFGSSGRHGIRMRLQLEQLQDGVWRVPNPADSRAVTIEVSSAHDVVTKCIRTSLALDEDVTLAQSGLLRFNGITFEPSAHRDHGSVSLGFIPPRAPGGSRASARR